MTDIIPDYVREQAKQISQVMEAKQRARLGLKPKPVNLPALVAPTDTQVAAVNTAAAALSGRAALSTISHDYINGADVLDGICTILRHWARWADEHWVTVTALWIAHTWFCDYDERLAFPATPRWVAIAPTQYGKSRMGKLVAKMSRDSIGPLSGVVTAPGVRDALHRNQTVILDEFHKLMGISPSGSGGRRREDLLAYVLANTPEDGSLNARSERGQSSSFAPVGIMSQPQIELSDVFEDMLNRAFVLHPQKARRGDKIPQLDADYYRMTKAAVQMLGLWAAQERELSLDDETQMFWPLRDENGLDTMPEVLTDRDYEISQPLVAVADRASDPELTAGDGLDLRWAIKGRTAVTAMKLGTGSADFAAFKADMERLEKA